MKEKVDNINSLNFKIDGLTVSNAAVKQTDDKVVVLTTAVQKGGEKYTVTLNEKAIGSFTGISSVVPSTIKFTNNSVQGVIGKQAILSADVGVKEAGIPVTFNVKADTNNTLNKDQVFETVTNAEGIATFSYTQYGNGVDTVSVYPTGAPATRDLGYIYWGVNTSLTVEADDQKGNTLNNGEAKVYKVTYLNPKDGKPVAGQQLKVTLAENVNTTVDKISTATVNGVNPKQLANDLANANPVTITTDSKGQATFTVSGTNTKATPVVFVDGNKVNILEADERQVKVDQLTFAADQVTHDIAVTRDGGEEAAVIDGAENNGRVYKIAVKNKDGKAAAGEVVNVAFNEDLDRVISTNTNAEITDDANTEDLAGEFLSLSTDKKQASVKLNSKGEAEFRIISSDKDDYATPIVWIDVNSANAKDGKLDEGEPYKLADKTFFTTPVLTAGNVKAYSDAGLTTRVKNDKTFKGSDVAYFAYEATNQSGKAISTSNLKSSFTVLNTGENEIEVNDNGTWKTVSPNRPLTVAPAETRKPVVEVRSKTGKTTSVRVEATATVVAGPNANKYLGKYTETAKFQGTNEVADFYTGLVTGFNVKDEKLQFDGKEYVSYKGATFTAANGNPLTQSAFEDHIQAQLATGKVSKVTRDKKDDKITISIIEDGVAAPAFVTNQLDVNDIVALTTIPTTAQQPGAAIALEDGTSKSVNVAWTSSDNTLLSISGNTATVGPVTEDKTVTLTAVFTKGTGSDQAKVTKTYSVKLTPTAVADVTRGQLSTQIADAKTAITTPADFTTASVAAVNAALAEAEAVVLVGTPAQAELNKASKDLTTAVSNLVSSVKVVAADAGTAGVGDVTLTFTASTVTTPATAITGLEVVGIPVASSATATATATADAAAGTVKVTVANTATNAAGETIKVTVKVNGATQELTLSYVEGSDNEWQLVGTPVIIR